jgi:antirestriction protein ArdC
MPWQRGGFKAVLPSNAVTGHGYRGINILSLWITALERGYEAGLFATYKQWASIGAQVRQGESAAPIVFYRQLEIARDGEGAEEGETATVRMARGYWVFAAEQVDGFTAPSALAPNPIDRIAAADAYVSATGARVVSGDNRACYRPSTDTIHMPDEARFSMAPAPRARRPITACSAEPRIMPRRCGSLRQLRNIGTVCRHNPAPVHSF